MNVLYYDQLGRVRAAIRRHVQTMALCLSCSMRLILLGTKGNKTYTCKAKARIVLGPKATSKDIHYEGHPNSTGLPGSGKLD